jgi:curved DNA-binding protein CbpA
MENPLEILEVETSTDADIRKAYLAKVKEFPPEKAPEEFRAISEAYELIKDESSRIRFTLFDQTPGADSPMGTLKHSRLLNSLRQPPSAPRMQEYLTQCLKIQHQK